MTHEMESDKPITRKTSAKSYKKVKLSKTTKRPERGKYVILKNRPIIESDVTLQDFVVIGKDGSQKAVRKTRIGKGTRILTGAIIYNGCDIGKNCLIADHADIRENCIIGDNTVIGRSVCIEMNTKIGSYVLVETQAHITGNMVIEDYVFIGPNVTTMNDKIMGHPIKFRPKLKGKVELVGPTIKRGARIGSAACILPNLVVGEEAVVGAGAVVTKDVPPYTVVVKAPAIEIKKVPKDEWLCV
jgi:acetyltransferase-like isoleucine patch superfamily enzyme